MKQASSVTLRACPPSGSRGFTLFEVLVALSLSLLLIAAVYAALNLYWRYSSAGQADVERAQLARAILHRIELDVRSVMYRPPPAATSSPSGSQSSSSGSGSSGSNSSGSNSSGSSGSNASNSSNSGSSSKSASGSSSSSGSSSGSGNSSNSSGSGSSNSSSNSGQSTADTESTTPDDAFETSTTGLYGNATTLMMHVSKPGREQVAALLAASGNQQSRMSDLATVAYFVSGSATGTLQQSVSTPGLARLEGDRLALSMADKQANVAATAAVTEILAPEVIALKFMYFDGFQWRADWDSSVLGGLPKAIDVEMALGPTPGSSRPGRFAGIATPNVYRLVIALPLAKPIDSAAVLAK